MALAASSVVSTAAVGAVVLGIAALAVRNIWKKKTNRVFPDKACHEGVAADGAAAAAAGHVRVKIRAWTDANELTFHRGNTIMKLSGLTAAGCKSGQFLCI